MTDTDKESILRLINDVRRHRSALQRLVDECMVRDLVDEKPTATPVCSHCGKRVLYVGAHDDGCPWKDAERVLERPVE